MPPLIRPFEPAEPPCRWRRISEIEDFERPIDPRLWPSAEMAATYCDELQTRSRTYSGAVFGADADGEIVWFVTPASTTNLSPARTAPVGAARGVSAAASERDEADDFCSETHWIMLPSSLACGSRTFPS